MCMINVTGFEKTQLPHKQYQTYNFTWNELLAQCTIIFHCWPCSKATSLVSVAAFLRPCVNLKWHFGAIGWSWLYCIGAWRAGQATKGWPMSVIFNSERCGHKKGPVGPQTGPLAFNCLCNPFCTPIFVMCMINVTGFEKTRLPHTQYQTYNFTWNELQYHYRHEKSCSKQLKFRLFGSYSPTQL